MRIMQTTHKRRFALSCRACFAGTVQRLHSLMLFAIRALLAFGETCDRGKQREDASENRCRRDGNPVDLAEDGRRPDCCDSGLRDGLERADARAF